MSSEEEDGESELNGNIEECDENKETERKHHHRRGGLNKSKGGTSSKRKGTGFQDYDDENAADIEDADDRAEEEDD